MTSTGASGSRRGKRPFTERWSWWLMITAWAWIRLPRLAYDLAKGNATDGSDWVALGVIALCLPLFLWARRREEHKRLLAEPEKG